MKLFEKQIARLSLQNREYRKFVEGLLEFLWRADVGDGDATTRLLKNPRRKVRACVVAKAGGVLAGVEEAAFFWRKRGVKILQRKKDGARIRHGEVIFKIEGAAEEILASERVVLNLLQRMSGVATAAERLAKRVGRRRFAATRKTPLGLLDTKAVVVGGGSPHRLSLADQILVKENHRAVEPDFWREIETGEVFEIEADSEKLACEIAAHFSKSQNLILLLDNFTPAEFRKAARKIRALNPKIILEASGGVDEKLAAKFLAAGADFVSLGQLTNAAVPLDLTLQIEN